MGNLKLEAKEAQSQQQPTGPQRPARTLNSLACQQELLRRVSGGIFSPSDSNNVRRLWP
jgi:hypothetical protein